LAAAGLAPAVDASIIPDAVVCDDLLPAPIRQRFAQLVTDLAEAGIRVSQLDSRSIAVASSCESDLISLEILASDESLKPSERLQAIRLKDQARRALLKALEAIGGTPVVRLRARITPKEEPKVIDEWSQL
jgi:hypothetical protein